MSEALDREPQSGGASSRHRIGLVEAMSVARRSVAMFTDLPVDAVVSAQRVDEEWRVIVDVIEAPARLGDNDLLVTYELMLAADGEVQNFARLRRYHREDGSGAPA